MPTRLHSSAQRLDGAKGDVGADQPSCALCCSRPALSICCMTTCSILGADAVHRTRVIQQQRYPSQSHQVGYVISATLSMLQRLHGVVFEKYRPQCHYRAQGSNKCDVWRSQLCMYVCGLSIANQLIGIQSFTSIYASYSTRHVRSMLLARTRPLALDAHI